MVNVAVLGYGTIGSGVVKVLRDNAHVITENAGTEIRVTHVLDLKDLSDTLVADIWTKDFNDILNDSEVDIVVEVMGGTGAAYTFVKAALESGKSAVTSNKALVAAYGPELLSIAKEKNVNFMFEASVGGGIPVIRPLLRCITADEICEITGILNGTTNYILTKMYTEGSNFADVLQEAQTLGYAEADPTADVEGHDACRKIAILTALANKRFADFNDFPCTGITGITAADVSYARAVGMKIKLLGSCVRDGNRICAEVAPFLIGSNDPLFGVDDVMNAIKVRGNMLGEVMFYGAGAGSLPTASAVVSDIIVEATHLHENIRIDMAPEKMVFEDPALLPGKFMIRVKAGSDIDGVLKIKEKIELAEYPEEFAVITDQITTLELLESTAGRGDIISYIKIK